jgi:hypothetical protein
VPPGQAVNLNKPAGVLFGVPTWLPCSTPACGSQYTPCRAEFTPVPHGVNILSSGRLPLEELQRHAWLEIAATLAKPYTNDEMLGTVKAVLRTSARAFGQTVPWPSWQSQPWAHGLRIS